MGNSFLLLFSLLIYLNSLLPQAGLGFRTMLTQAENLKALQAKSEVKLLEAGYCKFPLRSLIKINKRQSVLHTDGTIVRWRVELLKYCFFFPFFNIYLNY